LSARERREQERKGLPNKGSVVFRPVFELERGECEKCARDRADMSDKAINHHFASKQQFSQIFFHPKKLNEIVGVTNFILSRQIWPLSEHISGNTVNGAAVRLLSAAPGTYFTAGAFCAVRDEDDGNAATAAATSNAAVSRRHRCPWRRRQ